MHLIRGKSNGESVWIADLGMVDGKRRRKYFHSRAEAEAEIESAEALRRQAGDVWLSLSATERVEIASIVTQIRNTGMDPQHVWIQFRAQLSSAKPQESARITLREAIQHTLESKRSSGCRERYIESLEAYLRQFSKGREEASIGSITSHHIEEWFNSRKESPSSRASNSGRLSAMFGTAVRRGWITENPVDRLDPVRLEQKPPKILTPRQAARLLVWIRINKPQCLAHFVLGLMAGIRPEELQAISWDAVNLDEGVVVIDAAASKVRTRRIIHLQPAPLEWLKMAREMGAELPVAPITSRRALRALRDVLKLNPWPQDLLRHTAASYLLALKQDAGAVALELGNSPGVLLRVYRELVTRKDAARFWSLIPRDH